MEKEPQRGRDWQSPHKHCPGDKGPLIITFSYSLLFLVWKWGQSIAANRVKNVVPSVRSIRAKELSYSQYSKQCKLHVCTAFPCLPAPVGWHRSGLRWMLCTQCVCVIAEEPQLRKPKSFIVDWKQIYLTCALEGAIISFQSKQTYPLLWRETVCLSRLFTIKTSLNR